MFEYQVSFKNGNPFRIEIYHNGKYFNGIFDAHSVYYHFQRMLDDRYIENVNKREAYGMIEKRIYIKP